MKNTLIVLALFCFTASADLNSMAARVGRLVELKEKGLIGETPNGLVAVVKDGEDAASVVAAENADRREIYESRAKAAGTSLDAFMKVMGEARQSKEPKGRFIQKEGGGWSAK